MELTNDSELSGGEEDRPIVRFRDLSTVGEDAAARYLVGQEIDSGERVGIVVARPLADASPAVALAHADARVAAAQQAGTTLVEGVAPVRAVGRTAGGHPFAVSAIGDGTMLAEDLKGDDVVDSDIALELLLRAARVLSAAHAAGVVHGSVSPHVILTAPDGAVSLQGFGIAMPQMSPSSHADLGAREDVRSLARVGRTMLTDRRRESGRSAAVIPAALAALIARAESADPSLTANEFALGLEDAGHEQGQWHHSSADETAVIPAASAYDSSRWSRSWRPIARVVVAVGAVLALLLIFGDQILRSSDNEDPLIGAPVPYAESAEAGGTMYDSTSSGALREEGTLESDRRRNAASSGDVTGRAATPPGAGARQNPAAPPVTAQAGRGSGVVFASIPAGTTVRLSSGERVCTNTHFIGDRFPATVAEPVSGRDGVFIPAGSRASVQVTSVDHSQSSGDLASIGLAVRHVVLSGVEYPVDATITSVRVEQVRTSSTTGDAGKIVGGAVAGAILGQVLGKDTKSTVIGAATGAAAGTAIAMGTRDHAGCIPAGGSITIKLNTAARVAGE